MIHKYSAVLMFAALALGLLVLFGLGDSASATTVKLNYSSAHDCGGADANEGTVVDNSCAAGTGHNVGVTSDVQTVFDIQTGHSNYANTRTILASPAFNEALDSSIPNGAYVGYLTTTATISLLNGPCSSAVPVQIPLYDATTDVANTIDWTTDGSNLTVDSDGNGLADAIDKYPSFLNVMFSGQKPLARYYGYTNTTLNSPPTQLQFVIFAPGVLQGTTSSPGTPKPDQDINASLGYINYVALNNPVLGSQTAPSSISDICSPLNTTTRLFGKTQGEGRTIAAVPAIGQGELSANCRGANIGVDNDSDTVVDDGCIVVNDKCGDNIDGDADTKIDEYCVNATGLYAARTRSTNPATATSGIYGSGTHMAGAYLQGYRDADNDGIANEQDSCPTIANGRESGANCANALDDDGDTLINDGCPRVGPGESFPIPDRCSNAADDDGDTLVNDGCPPVEVDADGDGLGAACDPNDAVSNLDQDGDTFQNRQDLCPLVANLNQADTDSNRCNDAVNSDGADESPARVNDGCPAVGAAETACTDSADSDGDTVVNDGCPLKGFISEYCVVSLAGSGTNDWGPCSDSIGDACDANPTAVDGDYDKDMPRAAVCIGAADADLDGWCDATETALGSLASNAGNPGNQGANLENFSTGSTCSDGVDNDGDTFIDAADAGCRVPEYTGLAYPMPTGAPSVCSDLAWYASGTDPIGDGPAVDNDGDTLANALDAGCAVLAADTDQDGVPDATDNCVSVYNPDQTNSDTLAIGGGDSTGDACDANDDGDGLIDTAEWARGSDAKNPFSPFNLDLDGNGSVTGADASALKAWIGTAVTVVPAPSQVCLP